MMRYYNWYDSRRGWIRTKPGWYEVSFYPCRTIKQFLEIIDWLYKNVDNCEKHARWIDQTDVQAFKFRYEKDYVWFKLTWG